MRLLLDTNAFIWWADEPEKLSVATSALFADSSNVLAISIVSLWEMQIKIGLGKLRLSLPLRTLIEMQSDANAIEILPVQLSHLWALENLPHHHRDPFDRLIIAQAQVEQIPIVTADAQFARYDVSVIAA